MDFSAYIDSTFIALLPCLYGLAEVLKKTKLSNNFIPFVLTAVSVFITTLVTFATNPESTTAQNLITGIVQGILCTATTVYTHNLVKQSTEGGENNG